jgi:thiosulfate/3-mercaptopyruvate sulfurtransferase
VAYVNADSLVSADWVADHLDDPKVRILDGSYHLAATGRNGKAEYLEAHIPGALHFDIDAVCDPAPTLSPHMFPSAEDFAAAVGAMGISNDQRVIVYDADGLFSAPRVWWMFRAFGYENVAVMSGGFRNWKAKGLPVTSDIPAFPATTFSARLDATKLRAIEQIQANIASGVELVLDARAANRFDGSQPEARPGVEPGHIPGSANLPYAEIVDAEAGTFRDAETLRAAFDRVGVDGSRTVTTTCGSGVTACVLGLGMHLIGRENWALYDGSWTEWGSRDDTVKAKGAA